MNFKFLVLILFFIGCKQTDNSSVTPPSTGYILLDYTEGQSYDINYKDVNNMASKYNVILGDVYLTPIRDQSFSTSGHIELISKEDAHGSSMVAEGLAKKALEEGTAKLSSLVSGFNKKYSGTELDHSSIVNPLCDCLKNARSNDIVFLFSDILENDFGVNYRRMTPEEITSHLNSKCKSNTTIIAVVQAFRESDDEYLRATIPAYEAAFSNFHYVTNL